MGRTIVTPKKQAIPPGFLQELNCDLMEELWYALAAAKHPEAFYGSQPHPSLHEVFEQYLADVTWEDFWHAFPYELREQGDCLDEIDALGILLSSNISRSRFERHFEQLACSSSTTTSSSNNSSSSTQQVNLPVRISNVHRSSSSRALARAFSGAPAPRAGGYAAATAAMEAQEAAAEAEEWRRESEFMDMLLRRMSSGELQPNRGGLLESPEQLRQPPARRFSRRNLAPMPLPQLLPGQQLQQQQAAARQQHVAYVSPAAPGRTTATTRTGRLGLYAHLAQRANQQQQQQQPRSVAGTEQYADLFELLQQQLGTPPPDSPQWINPYGDPMLQDLPLAPSLDQFELSEPGLERRETTLMASIQAAIAARSAAAARAAESADYRDYAAAAAAAAAQATREAEGGGAAAAAGSMQPPRSSAEAGARRPVAAAAASGGAAADGASGLAEGAAARPHRGWWRQIVAEEGYADGPQVAFDNRGPPLFREQRAAPPPAAGAGTGSPPAPAAAAAGHGQRPRRVGMLLDIDDLAALGVEPPTAEQVPLLFGSAGANARAPVAAAGGAGGSADYSWQVLQQQEGRQRDEVRGSGEGDSNQEERAAAEEDGEDPEQLPVFRGRRGRSQRHTAARAEVANAQEHAEPRMPPAPAAAAAAAASAGPGAAAPAAPDAAAAAAPSGTGQRLTGQRRTWQEACDPESFEQERQQQQHRQQQRAEAQAAAAATGQSADTAAASTPLPPPAAAAAADTNAAAEAGAAAATTAGNSSSGSGRPIDYSKVWRAVHEWMTGEDEDLLGLVSQVVPYSMAGRGLKAQEDTLQQLRVLARSRAVPQKVITAVADRLYQPCPSGEAHLVRLTASSGFSKQAAAVAAVLDCVERHGMLPFYIPLAGLCTEDAVEAAVMRGLFGSAHAHDSLQQQQQQAQSSGGAASPAAADPLAADGTPSAAAAAANRSHQQSADLTLEDMGAMVALMESNQAVFRPSPAAVSPPQQLRGLGFGLGFPPSVRPASSTPSSRGSEEVDQLAAHLTLLGRCHSRQPMVLLLDEVDAAMTPDDGRPLREVLMQLLYRLPQAVVVMTSSSGLDAWRDAAVLRQVGEPMVQDLYDGRLVLVEHKLPKSHLHPRCYDYIL